MELRFLEGRILWWRIPANLRSWWLDASHTIGAPPFPRTGAARCHRSSPRSSCIVGSRAMRRLEHAELPSNANRTAYATHVVGLRFGGPSLAPHSAWFLLRVRARHIRAQAPKRVRVCSRLHYEHMGRSEHGCEPVAPMLRKCPRSVPWRGQGRSATREAEFQVSWTAGVGGSCVLRHWEVRLASSTRMSDVVMSDVICASTADAIKPGLQHSCAVDLPYWAREAYMRVSVTTRCLDSRDDSLPSSTDWFLDSPAGIVPEEHAVVSGAFTVTAPGSLKRSARALPAAVSTSLRQRVRRLIRAVLASLHRHPAVAVAVRGRSNWARITYTADLGCASDVFMARPFGLLQEFRNINDMVSTIELPISDNTVEDLASSSASQVQQRLALEMKRFRDAIGHRSQCTQIVNASAATCMDGAVDKSTGLAVLHRRIVQRSYSSYHRLQQERSRFRSIFTFSSKCNGWLETFILWCLHVFWYLWSPAECHRRESQEEETCEDTTSISKQTDDLYDTVDDDATCNSARQRRGRHRRRTY